MDQIDFDRFCQQEHWQHQGEASAAKTQHSDFECWQRWLTRQPLTIEELNQLPSTAKAVHQAWQDYHQGLYQTSLTHFKQALTEMEKNWPAINLDAALGICRIYTRTGQWQLARDWGTYALKLARKHNRLFDTSRTFNALGDLFCRAGYTQFAHLFLMSSTNVLPQGSVHKARHYNSLATVLMRQKAYLRAEALLMNSLYLAHDNQDSDSVWHALARLQWLYIETNTQIMVHERFNNLIPAKHNAIANAYMEIAQAVMIMHEQPKLAEHLLNQAANRTSTLYPIESAWFARCAGNQTALNAEMLNLPLYPAPAAEGFSCFDSSWQQVELANNQLNWLVTPQSVLSAQHLLTERQAFFI